MAQRWYVMPAALVDVPGRGLVRRPEFIDLVAPGATWAWMPVNDGWGVGWADLTAAQHSNYSGRAGVRFLTANLDNNLGATAVTALKAALDARELPSSWVSTAITWRQAIKRILSFVQCVQRFYGETRSSLNAGRPRTTLLSALSVGVRERLLAVSDSLLVPRQDDAVDTIEDMMQRWADVLVLRPVHVGGVQL